MTQRSRGPQSKTRKKLRKSPREHGMPAIGCIVREFAPGAKVDISVNSFTHKGRPALRFQGYNGKVIERRGNSYMVEIKEGNKIKRVIVSPIHLK